MTRIVLYPRPVPAVLEIGRALLPTGYELDVVDAAELAAALVDAEYLMGFVGPIPEAAWEAAKSLRLVQLMSAGYDDVQIDEARAKRIPVSLNGGANAIGVAEHTVMLMLAVYKHLAQLDHEVRLGGWKSGRRQEARITEIGGKRVGLLGLGQIGRQVIKRLRGFDVELFYYDVRRLAPAEEASLGVTYLELVDLIAGVDVLSLHLPLLPETRGIIGAVSLATMRPGSILINTARGELVDEDALAAALRAGPLGGAGLDVLTQEPPPADHPLFSLNSVIITPHIAGPTWESWPRRFANGYANIARVARGERPEWVIPELRHLLTDWPTR